MFINTTELKSYLDTAARCCMDQYGNTLPQYKYRLKTLLEQYALVSEVESIAKAADQGVYNVEKEASNG